MPNISIGPKTLQLMLHVQLEFAWKIPNFSRFQRSVTHLCTIQCQQAAPDLGVNHTMQWMQRKCSQRVSHICSITSCHHIRGYVWWHGKTLHTVTLWHFLLFLQLQDFLNFRSFACVLTTWSDYLQKCNARKLYLRILFWAQHRRIADIFKAGIWFQSKLNEAYISFMREHAGIVNGSAVTLTSDRAGWVPMLILNPS